MNRHPRAHGVAPVRTLPLGWLKQHKRRVLLGILFLAPGALIIATHLPRRLGLPLTWSVLAVPLVTFWLAALTWSLWGRKDLQRTVMYGYGSGLIATVVYSLLFRWPAVMAQLIPDLPLQLGDQLTGVTDPYWERTLLSVGVGYAAHLLITGAGFGVAYAVLPLPRTVLAGTVWGLFIGACYVLSPLFPASFNVSWVLLSPPSAALLILLTHVPYGITLAWLLRWFETRNPTLEISKAPQGVTQ